MTIPQAFQIAVQHHQSGRLAEAEALYRQILAAQPNHAGALNAMGVIAQQVGRCDVAVEWIRRAIACEPKNADNYSNLGVAYRVMGRLDEAVAAFRQALEIRPDYAEAHNNLGNALLPGGKRDEAIAAYRRAIELMPQYAEAHNNLGIALVEGGRFDEAAVAYRRALQLRPDYLEAHNGLGVALKELGQFEEAINVYRRALQLKPDYPEVLNNLGNALKDQGKLGEAIAAFRQALQLTPHYLEAHNNLGAALGEKGEVDEAVASYRRAFELQPDMPEAHNNLGNALKDQGEMDGAIAAYREAIRIKRDFAEAHSNLIFALHLLAGQNREAILEEQERWNRQFSDLRKATIRPHLNDRSPDRRLRVGYVSPDLRDHPVGRFLLPLLERHDREQFEIFCYSGAARTGWMTERLRALTDGWRDTMGISDERLAEIIREDGVDILVDLALHTADNRLLTFARQPAPVQVSWLAYPGGVGVSGIGYRLTDDCMEPLGEAPTPAMEEAIRLPRPWVCYQPAEDSPEVSALPALSVNAVIFGSLNNFAKVNEEVLALWARILEVARESRLLMLCPEGRARERVRAFFEARGIAATRVEFVGYTGRWEYLSLHHRIDIGLDPFPYNGMTTTCDALWMGVPVLTLPGEMPCSRAGLSLLSSVGLGECAVSYEEGYVRKASELAGDLSRLADLRATLRSRLLASALMDAPRFARNVEAAYRVMWERWCVAGG